MAGFEQTIIIGNVGRDPEIRTTNNSQVANFTVAVSRRWRDKATQEQREVTNWYRVNCWGPLAETATRIVRKGVQIMVVGAPTASAYVDKDGQARASLELRAENFQLLGSRADNAEGGSSGSDNYGEYNSGSTDRSIDDIPF
jgi:single-strand DNA-binding protein